ncbi:MAG: hypothetical protein ABIF18_04165 [archaeon]
MGLFSKKDEIPSIPMAPTLPELPSIEEKGLPELPSFPMNSKNKELNQEMVKSAVTDTSSLGEKELYMETPEDFHVIEESGGGLTLPPKPSMENSIPRLPSIMEARKRTLELTPSTIERPASKQVEPIFVRIDKFQAAHKNFEQIKNKVEEIESVLKKINDIKSREETELKGWTEDIEKIKSRLAEVDANIFNQI